MGMEIVELVMAVEEEFDIAIPDDVAAQAVTVGKLHATVLTLLEKKGAKPDSEETYARLKRVVIDQLGVKPSAVVPTASFVNDLRCD